MTNRTYDLENRLINFAVRIIGIAEKIQKSFVGKHLSYQLIKSGTSPALNYGEAQSAESMKDFIHKMKICLKELRETSISLKIIDRLKNLINPLDLPDTISKNEELISIFVKSIETANRNFNNKK